MRGDFCPGARYTVARAAEQLINDELGIVTYLNGSPAAVLSFEIDAAHIRSVYRILNPEKLKNIPACAERKVGRSRAGNDLRAGSALLAPASADAAGACAGCEGLSDR